MDLRFKPLCAVIFRARLWEMAQGRLAEDGERAQIAASSGLFAILAIAIAK